MKSSPIKGYTRWLLVACGLALIVVLFVPLWKIELMAPQYPEGLELLIYPHKLAGNVDIINGLNHYIGMKTLHTEDFIEFTLLPYIISVMAALFFLVAFLAKRKLLNALFVLFVVFGVLAMYDFWRWEYNYGHNLNPDAAIIVPGMAYQPPLIGFKQLLNFGAYSIPDIGGLLFIAVGALLLVLVIAEWRYVKKLKLRAGYAVASFILMSISSCSVAPEPIKAGVDHCYSCKMTISDVKFAAELVSTKGKIYKFDDTHCVLHFLHSNEIATTAIKDIYHSNYSNATELVNVKESMLLQSEGLRTPMGGNIAAFNNRDSMLQLQNNITGTIVKWTDLLKK